VYFVSELAEAELKVHECKPLQQGQPVLARRVRGGVRHLLHGAARVAQGRPDRGCRAAAAAGLLHGGAAGRGLHSFTLELNMSNSMTHS
jgi:hypothetical protein